jgi:hypothetical protein
MDGSMFGKSDPFFSLSKLREDGSNVRVYQSEVRPSPTVFTPAQPIDPFRSRAPNRPVGWGGAAVP